MKIQRHIYSELMIGWTHTISQMIRSEGDFVSPLLAKLDYGMKPSACKFRLAHDAGTF